MTFSAISEVYTLPHKRRLRPSWFSFSPFSRALLPTSPHLCQLHCRFINDCRKDQPVCALLCVSVCTSLYTLLSVCLRVCVSAYTSLCASLWVCMYVSLCMSAGLLVYLTMSECLYMHTCPSWNPWVFWPLTYLDQQYFIAFKDSGQWQRLSDIP